MASRRRCFPRAVPASYGKWESVWSSDSYCAPVLCDGGDVFEKCVYTLCNPNKARLVRHVLSYRGLCSRGLEYGARMTCERPDALFTSRMPDVVEVVLTRPPQTRPDLSDRQLRAAIRREVEHREIANGKRVRREGGSFLGMKGVLRQRITDTPKTSVARRGIRPRVACRCVRARMEAIRRDRRFQADYRDAWRRYAAGDRNVEFPYGTYKLRVECGVRCAAPP